MSAETDRRVVSYVLPCIPLKQIIPNPYNPRRLDDIDERKHTEELAMLIRSSKCLYYRPPVAYRVKGRKDIWAVIAGHRTVEAARINGEQDIRIVSTAMLGLPAEMTHEEALELLLKDQLSGRKFDTFEKYKMIRNGLLNGNQLFQRKSPIMRVRGNSQLIYLAMRAPTWMNNQIDSRKLKVYTAFEISKVAFEYLKDEVDSVRTMMYLSSKCVSGEWTRREQLRDWIRWAKSNKKTAAAEILGRSREAVAD